jgi:putative aldouronate transport system substrate-binding protein
VALLAVSGLALTACSDSGSGGGEPLESLDIMAPFFSAAPPAEDDPIDQALSEIAGLDLSVQWVPNSDYGAKTNTVLAGDDIPDVMVIQGKDQAFVQTAEAGGFWDLTEHLTSGEYPNLVTENPDVQEAASVNGKVYGVYRARDVIRTGRTGSTTSAWTSPRPPPTSTRSPAPSPRTTPTATARTTPTA